MGNHCIFEQENLIYKGFPHPRILNVLLQLASKIESISCLIYFKDEEFETSGFYFLKKSSLFQRDEGLGDRNKRKWEWVKRNSNNL